MSIVLDASMALAWCLRDEARPELEVIFLRVLAEVCHVPALWTTEVANALLVAERRKRIAPGDLELAWKLFDDVQFEVDPVDPRGVLDAVVPLARDHNLTVYDACYLELAIRLGAGIATLDQRLTKASALRGVPVLTA